MQNTLPLTPGNPLRNITGLARQISLPGEHAPLRFPSFPALERTAVMAFNQPATLAIPTSASTGTAITVFRQACYPVWADQTATYINVVDYSTDVFPQTLGEANTSIRSAVSNWAIGNRAANLTYCGITGSVNGYLKNWALLGADRGLPGPEFMYNPLNCSLFVVVNGNATSAGAVSVRVNLERWTSPGESASAFADVGTGQFSMSAAMNVSNGNVGNMVGVLGIPGWFRPHSISLDSNVSWTNATVTLISVSGGSNVATYTASASDAGTVAITPTSAVSMHLPLVFPAEFSNSPLPWYATRVTAAAMLGTNVTQVLNKGGTILGGRVSPAVKDPWLADYAYISALHPAEKAYLPCETGVYTYCPPSTDLVFFGDYTLNTSGTYNAGIQSAPIFLLSNDSLYNKMFIRTGGADEALACTVTWHIEFRTSSALFQIGLSAMTLESLHQAQLVLAEAGFFFENPEHEGLLSKVIRTAKKYAPDVVSVVNPTAGKMLQSIIAKMGSTKAVKPKAGPTKAPATSADKSGITAKPKPKAKAAKKK